MVSTALVPRRRWLRVLALVSALALVVAACGDDGDGEAADSETGESADAQHGGEITYALEAETLNFCLPMAQLAIGGIMVATSVYDTLVAQNGDGEVVPFLAESFESNDDATVWTITLRDGVQFHNGEPLNAEAVAENINAWRGAVVAEDVNDGEPFPSTLFKTVMNMNPEGLFAIDEQPELNEGIAEVTVVDDLTLEVTMHEPWADWPALVYASSRLGIVAPEQLRAGTGEDGGCATRMIGTGPFVHANPPEVREPRVERNENYWREDSEGRQLPYLDAVQFRAQPFADQRVAGLQGGQFDVTHVSLGQNEREILDLQDQGRALAYVEEPGFREIGYLLINNGKPPFDNENARKAVFLAADRAQINELINDGQFELADGLFDEDTGGYLEPDESGLPDDSDRDAALEEAREYAEAYEAETGESLTFEALTTTDPTNTAIIELLQQNLADADIQMSIAAPVLQSEIINLAVGGALGTALEDAPQAFLWRNHPGGGEYCSAQGVWFYSDWPINFAIIDDPEVDRLFSEARKELDTDRRQELCREVNLHMNEQLYNGWNWWSQWTIGTGTNVNGIWGPDLPDGSPPPDNMAGFHRLDGIWLD